MTWPQSERASLGSTPEAKLVFDGDFAGLGDNSESYIMLTGLDKLSTDQVLESLQKAYQKLQAGGQISFWVFDFQVAVRIYIAEGLTKALMYSLAGWERGRRSFWDELSITRALFDVGYYKVWTGHEAGRPDFELIVKAMKEGPSIDGRAAHPQ